MKLVNILIISVCFIILLSQPLLAMDEIISTGEDWWGTGQEHAGIGINTENLKEGSNQIYNVLLAIATIVAVIAGAILGVKYMTAGINDKVKVKESLIPYLTSCIIVFGSFGIWKLVVTIMKSMV